ncbi:MAG: magnesium transporter, partial [Rhodospirillales bacterium]|nr:magnesium transporter [Rhodospirillales bacterium]
MSDPAEAVDPDRAEKPAEKAREGFELDRAVVDAVEEAIDRDDHEEVRALLEPVHDADVADLLQNLSSEERRTVVEALRSDFPPDVLAELDERVRDEVIEELGIAETVNAVRELETDDAVHIISELEEDQQELVLKAIPAQDRTLIEEALAYPDYSAGRLMRRELVAVPVFWTVGDTIDHLRATAEANPDALPDEFFDIFVVDPGHRPVGSVGLSRMLRTRRAEPMTGIMSTDLKVIDATTDQEDVAFLFR